MSSQGTSTGGDLGGSRTARGRFQCARRRPDWAVRVFSPSWSLTGTLKPVMRGANPSKNGRYLVRATLESCPSVRPGGAMTRRSSPANPPMTHNTSRPRAALAWAARRRAAPSAADRARHGTSAAYTGPPPAAATAGGKGFHQVQARGIPTGGRNDMGSSWNEVRACRAENVLSMARRSGRRHRRGQPRDASVSPDKQ